MIEYGKRRAKLVSRSWEGSLRQEPLGRTARKREEIAAPHYVSGGKPKTVPMP